MKKKKRTRNEQNELIKDLTEDGLNILKGELACTPAELYTVIGRMHKITRTRRKNLKELKELKQSIRAQNQKLREMGG